MAYAGFDYSLQGVRLTDARWENDPNAEYEGAWVMAPDTDALPMYPGIQVTEFNVPGGHGERQVQHAPMEPRNINLTVRFLAVETNPSKPGYKRSGGTWDERQAQIEANVNEFMFRTRLGSQSALGEVTLTRVNPHFEHFLSSRAQGDNTVRPSTGNQVATGRFISSASVDRDPDMRWADYSFVFRDRHGCWMTSWQYFAFDNISGGINRTLNVPMGTAPVIDALVAIRTRSSGNGRARVTNLAGHGFYADNSLNRGTTDANRWWVYDTLAWRAGGGNLGGGRPWTMDKPHTRPMEEIRRPLGTALQITPGISDVGQMRGRINVRLPTTGDVHVALRPRWY